jgi:hypothetical protein
MIHIIKGMISLERDTESTGTLTTNITVRRTATKTDWVMMSTTSKKTGLGVHPPT